jgi:large subunit ribosomal protein L31
MKKGIHPASYRMVAFRDMSNGHTFITRSTVQTRETVEIEGVQYPLIKLEISNTSHPFYTGKVKLVDTAGRVDKFMSRYKTHMEKRNKYFLQRKNRGSGNGAFFLPVHKIFPLA